MGFITTELLESKRDGRGRRITPAAQREALLRAYAQSGLTQEAFARREGIKYPTLVSWLRRRGPRRPRVTRRPRASRFSPVSTTSAVIVLIAARITGGEPPG